MDACKESAYAKQQDKKHKWQMQICNKTEWLGLLGGGAGIWREEVQRPGGSSCKDLKGPLAGTQKEAVQGTGGGNCSWVVLALDLHQVRFSALHCPRVHNH